MRYDFLSSDYLGQFNITEANATQNVPGKLIMEKGCRNTRNNTKKT